MTRQWAKIFLALGVSMAAAAFLLNLQWRAQWLLSVNAAIAISIGGYFMLRR